MKHRDTYLISQRRYTTRLVNEEDDELVPIQILVPSEYSGERTLREVLSKLNIPASDYKETELTEHGATVTVYFERDKRLEFLDQCDGSLQC